jgi:ribosome biogenesis GTPase A
VAPNTFHIGVDDVNKCVKEVRQLLDEDKSFAILMPVSITSEISRLENKDGQRCHDESLAIKVKSMSKITLASSSEVWLVNLPGVQFNHFLSNDMEGLGLTGCKAVFQESLVREMDATAQMNNHNAEMLQSIPETRSRDQGEMFQSDPETGSRDQGETLEAFPMTRSRLRADTTITTPAANTILSGDRTTTEHDTRTIALELDKHTIKWKNVPRPPIP